MMSMKITMTDILQIMPYNINIDPTIRPHQVKSDWIPAAITAAAGLVGGLISSKSQARAQQRANEQNLQIARETNQANKEISAGVNNMNWQIMRENNAYNRQLAFDMFNAENAYNDPRAQMARMKGAGINPFVAAGEVGNVEGRIDTLPSQTPPVATGIPAQMGAPVQPVNPLPASFSSEMANIAAGLSQLADARQKGVATDQSIAMFEDVLRKLQSESDLTENQALNERYNYTVNMFTGVKRVQKELRNLDATWAKFQQDMNESEARIVRMDFQNTLDDIQAKLHGTELERFEAVRPFLEKMAQQQYDNLVKQGELLDSQSYSARASGDASLMNARSNAFTALKEGNYKDALTETENAMRGSKVRFENLQARKMYWDVQFLMNTISERVTQQNLLTRQMKQTLNKTVMEVLKLDKETDVIHASKIGAIYQDLKIISRELLGDSFDLPK